MSLDVQVMIRVPAELTDRVDVLVRRGPVNVTSSLRFRSNETSKRSPVGFLKSILAPVLSLLQTTGVPSVRDQDLVELPEPVRLAFTVTRPPADDFVLVLLIFALTDTIADLLSGEALHVLVADVLSSLVSAATSCKLVLDVP